MKFIDTLLGFAVLTGPLWLILLLLPVCVWLAIKLAKRFKPGISRIAGGIGVFLLLFALPFGDEIAGRAYLSYLCATEAGVKVYQTVELPAEYWDEKGRPKFIKGIGGFDTAMLSKYDVEYTTEQYPSFFRIEKFRFKYVEKENGKILGEGTDFHYFGGWISQNFNPGPGGGASCDRADLRDSKGTLLSIFRPAMIQSR